jgi:hypothetical protein
MAAGPDHLVGVRVERDHHDGQPAFLPGLGGAFDDALMAAVHAVELADRDDRLAPLCGHLVKAVPAVHDASSSLAPDQA